MSSPFLKGLKSLSITNNNNNNRIIIIIVIIIIIIIIITIMNKILIRKTIEQHLQIPPKISHIHAQDTIAKGQRARNRQAIRAPRIIKHENPQQYQAVVKMREKTGLCLRNKVIDCIVPK